MPGEEPVPGGGHMQARAGCGLGTLKGVCVMPETGGHWGLRTCLMFSVANTMPVLFLIPVLFLF